MKKCCKDDTLEGRFYFDTVSSVFLGTSSRNFIPNPLIDSKSELLEDKSQFLLLFQIIRQYLEFYSKSFKTDVPLSPYKSLVAKYPLPVIKYGGWSEKD